MPELPEVETVRTGIENALLRKKVSGVKLYRENLRVPFPAHMDKTLKTYDLSDVRRRAKYLLLDFTNETSLIIHLGMSGKILITKDNVEYDLQKHDHMVITFENNQKLILNDARRFGMVYMCDTKDWQHHKAFKHLGPEPLSDDFTANYLANTLKNKKAPIKTTMMDQRVVVGVGNIYINEALFKTRIHPETPSCALSKNEYGDLVKTCREILIDAIEKGGSSLRDYKNTDGDMGYFQYNFAVYNKKNQACTGCNCDINKTGGIQRIKQAGRSTFYCPAKQKRKRAQ